MSNNATSHRIRSISVIGGFLDGAQFELADGLNCFIGARGTGKTTALEFVRYALDALPVREDQPVDERRIESLVERNLAGGRVEVRIETKDGLAYIISRSTGEEPLVWTAERQPTDISFKAGGIFQADIYSQNEVESIADHPTPGLPAQLTPSDHATQTPFAGGEMVFHADRVTLCDVTVLVNSRAKQMRKLLDELRRRGTKGAFVARSGPELVDLIGIRGGQNSVAGAVRDFRKNVAEILLEQLGLASGPQDVIRSGGPGYRLHEWISVRDAESGVEEPSDINGSPPDDSETDRRQRILAELRKGEKLRVSENCSLTDLL